LRHEKPLISALPLPGVHVGEPITNG
jgi:hypothetical protein